MRTITIASIGTIVAVCLLARDDGAKISIVSPRDGTVVHPGQVVEVVVVSSVRFELMELHIETPLRIKSTRRDLPAGPYHFVVEVPEGAASALYKLEAFGLLKADEGQIIVSPPIMVDVELPNDPIGLSAIDAMDLAVGDESAIQIDGVYSDGSTEPLTNSRRIKLSSQNPNIVKVTLDGRVNAIAPGTTKLIATFGKLRVEVPVVVEPPVRLTPDESTLTASGSVQVSALVTTDVGKPDVTWSTVPAGVGVIDANGVYTAPDTIASQQSVKVVATRVSDPAQSASMIVTLSPEASVDISPGWAVVYPGQAQQFTAAASNAGNAGVRWSLTPGGAGTMTTTGLYRAPASISSLQKITATATSIANSAISGTVTFWISPKPFVLSPNALALTISPGSSAATPVAFLASDGFAHPVSFSVTGLPAGVTAKFEPAQSIGSAGTQLTLIANATAAAGSYKCSVVATDTVVTGLVSSVPLAVTVSSSQAKRSSTKETSSPLTSKNRTMAKRFQLHSYSVTRSAIQ